MLIVLFQKYICQRFISKVYFKGISVIKKLRHTFPRKSLITIYKVFLRPLIDYGDIIYDQPNNGSFCEKLESIQYQAALATTGATQGTSRDRIYAELGLESRKLEDGLHLKFSHLNEHRFRHNFEECVNLLYSCSLKTEDTENYLLHCHHFTPLRINLMNSVNSVLYNFESLSDINKKEILLYGDPRLDNNKNRIIVEATLNYIKVSEIFSGSLFEE